MSELKDAPISLAMLHTPQFIGGKNFKETVTTGISAPVSGLKMTLCTETQSVLFQFNNKRILVPLSNFKSVELEPVKNGQAKAVDPAN